MAAPHKSRFVRIHSNEGRVPVDLTTLSKIDVNTNDPDLNQIAGVRIKTAMIPNSMYNINSSNKTLYMTTSLSGTTDYTITEGQYTITTLIAALQTVINAAIGPATMTITQNAHRNLPSHSLRATSRCTTTMRAMTWRTCWAS
jgi:hypothetical protein